MHSALVPIHAVKKCKGAGRQEGMRGYRSVRAAALAAKRPVSADSDAVQRGSLPPPLLWQVQSMWS